MNIVLLTCGQGGKLSVHHVHHQVGIERTPTPRTIHLLVLDSRRMESDCFAAACAEIATIRKALGLNHGVLLCQTPTLPLTVAAIRCGLRDVICRYVSASHLRALLQAAHPGVRLTVQEFDAIATFLRTFSGLSVSEGPIADLAKRETELARKSEQLAGLESRLAVEKEAIITRDRELRERTRRLDRQLAMQQTDADVVPTASPQVSIAPFELEVMSKRLEKRAAELDVREKLLTEMEALVMAHAQGLTSSDGGGGRAG